MFRKKKCLPTATAIIVAAGSGSRMGSGTNKQFILINDMPVLAHTLLKFSKAETIDSIIVVTKPESILAVSALVREFNISKVTNIIPGGETRQDSVNCGLDLVNNNTLVAIHDGARPFISVKKINELVITAHTYGAAAPGVTPKDTVKIVSPENTIEATPDRNSLRLIQTPQVFRAEAIMRANTHARQTGFFGTDDCSIAENAGIQICIVDGEYTNIKVTTPEDLPIAEAIHKFLDEI